MRLLQLFVRAKVKNFFYFMPVFARKILILPHQNVKSR